MIIVQKEKFKLVELVKQRWEIISIVIMICALEALSDTFVTAVDLYIGDFFVLLDSKNLFGIIVWIIKLSFYVYLIPMKLVILSYKKKGTIEIVNSPRENEDVLDDAI